MVGTIPVPGNLSMADLAATLTVEEAKFEQMTSLGIDPTAARNLATFIAQDNQLGELAIVARDAPSEGIKIYPGITVYILGAQTPVDVYRLAL